ncbi:MAG: thioredoxin family protein [Aureispira sp.]
MKWLFASTILLSLTFWGGHSLNLLNPSYLGGQATITPHSNKQALLGYNIGDIASDFSLLNIDGKQVSLKDFPEAKGFILVFTCNHCPYSVAYENRLIALDKKYKTKGYPVIAINPNNPAHYPIDSYENMQVRAKSKGFTFPYLFDKGQKIYPQYGATKTPHTYVLQKTRKGNRVEYIGAIDNNVGNAAKASEKFVEAAVDALLQQKEPLIRKTKAIGCSIKV